MSPSQGSVVWDSMPFLSAFVFIARACAITCKRNHNQDNVMKNCPLFSYWSFFILSLLCKCTLNGFFCEWWKIRIQLHPWRVDISFSWLCSFKFTSGWTWPRRCHVELRGSILQREGLKAQCGERSVPFHPRLCTGPNLRNSDLGLPFSIVTHNKWSKMTTA